MEKRILLIDDDQEDADIFREALGAVDRSTIFDHLPDCREAVQLLLKQPLLLPDLIFLDINMPVMNGLDCLEELKKQQNLRQIPVVMYTTSVRPAEILSAQRLGAHEFWTKPNNYGDLIRKLKELIHGLLFRNA